jgi:hypothetical protein
MLVVVAILGIVVAGLGRAISATLAAYSAASSRQALLTQGRYATERMMMFIRESDELKVPAGHKLEVSERVLDMHHNATRLRIPTGDGIPDADDDRNGVVNDSDSDKKSFVLFEEKDGQILEYLPNYETPEFNDRRPGVAICRNVTEFKCKKLADDLVEFRLDLSDGEHTVTWTTRGKARMIRPD